MSPKVFENKMIRDRDPAKQTSPHRRNNVLMTTPNSRASSTQQFYKDQTNQSVHFDTKIDILQNNQDLS